MSSQGVSTDEYRFRFVEKSLGDVGGGTPWPMEATLDQISELWFRVNDAELVQGEAYQATGDPTIQPEGGYSIQAPTAASSARAYATSSTEYIYRGYTTPVEEGTATISADNDPYLDAEYDRGDTAMWRDINEKERGMWIEGDHFGDVLPYWNEKDGLYPPVNAFCLNCEKQDIANDSYLFSGGVTLWGPFGTFVDATPDVSASVVFSGEIAIVRNDPADGFFAPTNRFFIGVKFFASVDPSSSDLSISTDLSDFSGTTYEACKYKIRLADIAGSPPTPVYIECPIYMEVWPVASGSGASFIGGQDFIHEATAWWPYAKGDPPAPVWNSATGAEL
jgi:hypothetical protein